MPPSGSVLASLRYQRIVDVGLERQQPDDHRHPRQQRQEHDQAEQRVGLQLGGAEERGGAAAAG
jgi:hypothetical protein